MSEQFIYNNFFNEFKGDTPDDVIQEIYRESAIHTGASYAEWWSYQQHLWQQGYGAKIPEAHEAGACNALLKVLLEVGALEEGAKPVTKTTLSYGPR